MKRCILILLLIFPAFTLSAQTIGFTHAVVVDNHVGYLSWNNPGQPSTYRLYRLFPDQFDYTCIATLTDTFYYDTLHRTICADTVNYVVQACTPSDTLSSYPVGLFYQDNIPTSPCSLRLCTVDTILRQIRLSWYPSPDTDVMGYYICMGSPCRDYDTVWGRLNTTYLCHEVLSPGDPSYCFRILAFDSCFQASPLTPYYRNPSLSVQTDDPCSRLLRFDWNRYINMPDSVARYTLHYKLGSDPDWRTHNAPADGPYHFDTLISDLSIGRLHAYLSVNNLPDTLQALSLCYDFHFDYGDTAEYLRIADISYSDAEPSVTLTIEIDPLFGGRDCYLYRATGDNDWFDLIASLSRSDISPEQFLNYTDRNISRGAGRYSYKVGVPDLCNHWIKYSDTVQLLLPDVSQAAAYIPNTIIYGDPDNGYFCPHYLSPLSDGYSLDIYNRYGSRMFHTSNLSDCWDGTDPYGRPLPQGVYVYQSRCRHADGSEKIYKGTILLLR